MASWVALRAAVHALELEEDAWVEALLREARELFDEGLGTFVYTYRTDPDVGIRLGALAGARTASGFWDSLDEWGGRNAHALARVYATGVSSLHEAVHAMRQNDVAVCEPRRPFADHGVGDLLTLAGHDSTGAGIFLTVPCAESRVTLSSRERVSLERLAFELLVSVRLREERRRQRHVRLTRSEGLVARRLLEGASDKTIAQELGISLSTVSTFVRRTRCKLGCRPGGEALALATFHAPRLEQRLALLDRLTPAERDVASALLVGSSYSDIAARRAVSERTVASQCSAIFRKCGVSGRRELSAVLLGTTSGK